MKLFLINFKLKFLILILFFGCNKENQTFEEQIANHKNRIYQLSDSLKLMDQKIDSLIKIYSK
tara:strand:- start:4 stop:192 length:189 start_codon:yes stop_codon:yes gene_type:complete